MSDKNYVVKLPDTTVTDKYTASAIKMDEFGTLYITFNSANIAIYPRGAWKSCYLEGSQVG